MCLPTTISSLPALQPVVLRGWEMWPFLKNSCGGAGTIVVRNIWWHSPPMTPFRLWMDQTSLLVPAFWQWKKESLMTIGIAAGLSSTWLLIIFLQKLMYIPSLSLVSHPSFIHLPSASYIAKKLLSLFSSNWCIDHEFTGVTLQCLRTNYLHVKLKYQWNVIIIQDYWIRSIQLHWTYTCSKQSCSTVFMHDKEVQNHKVLILQTG